MVFITVSNIGQRAHWAQLVFAFAIIGTCVATIPLLSHFAPLRWPHGIVPYIVILSVGCCALVGQSTFNYGMQLCQSAVTSSLVRQSDLIFAFIYQALFLHQKLTWYVIVGGCFVLGGALTDAIPKVIKELRHKGYLRSKKGQN